MTFIERAEKLLSIDSSSDVGNVYVCKHLKELASKLGLETVLEKHVVDGVEEHLLYIAKDKTSLDAENVFWSNLQTHDPGPYSYWDETGANPFRLSIKGDRLYGLGASSGKLDFLIRLIALAETDFSSPKSNLVLVGGFGDFVNKQGAKAFVKNRKSKVKTIFVSEPTDLKINTNYSGKVVVKMFIPFEEKEIAIREKYFSDEVTATQTKVFHSKPYFSFHKKSENQTLQQLRDFLQNLPSNAIILNMELGDSPYMLPAEAIIEMDLADTKQQSIRERFLDLMLNIDWMFQKKFSRYIKKYDLKAFPDYNIGFIRTAEDGLEIEGCFYLTHGVDQARIKDWLSPLNSNYVDISIKHFHAANKYQGEYEQLESLGQGCEINLNLEHLPTDTSYFMAKGFTAVGFGPGCSDGYRLMNEYNGIEQIERATEIYKKIFKGLV